MNLKNQILGFVAFTFAVGSAFVSASLTGTIYVKAYTSQANFEEGIVHCVNTGETCEDRVAPGIRCSVQVNTQTSGYVTTSNTYKDGLCTQQILETTTTLPASGIMVYDLAESKVEP